MVFLRTDYTIIKQFCSPVEKDQFLAIPYLAVVLQLDWYS